MRDEVGQKFMTFFLLISFLLLGGGIFLLWTALPSMGVLGTPIELVGEDAKISQTIVYTKCNHEVLRSVDVFPEWVGMNKEKVVENAAENWRVISFGPKLIEVICTEDLFCSQHWVLALGGDGLPGVYHNQYGFSMVKYGDVTLDKLDEETRELLVYGKAFDSREELNQWVRLKQNNNKTNHQVMVE